MWNMWKKLSVHDLEHRSEVSRMQRLCPACFTELPEEANYCPVCGKCMREPVEQSSKYVGCVPVTTVVGVKDCTIHIGEENGLDATSTNRTT